MIMDVVVATTSHVPTANPTDAHSSAATKSGAVARAAGRSMQLTVNAVMPIRNIAVAVAMHTATRRMSDVQPNMDVGVAPRNSKPAAARQGQHTTVSVPA
jgi:hypothetical protein